MMIKFPVKLEIIENAGKKVVSMPKRWQLLDKSMAIELGHSNLKKKQHHCDRYRSKRR